MRAAPIDWESEIATALQTALGPSVPANLAASIRYSVLSPGKRFRPRLMEASATTLDVAHEAFIPFAVALEWIHSFTLIHDDLPCMDDDDFRRGMPTNHKIYGEALALLAGDALIPAAFEWTLQSPILKTAPAAWQSAFARLVRCSGPAGVIGGQAMEMLVSEKEGLLSQMHALKTGALFEAALLIPAHLAGLNQDSPQFAAIHCFSAAFGRGFQVADDLEDAEQERDAVSGYPPTSILHSMTPEAARDQALARLDQACSHLQSVFSGEKMPLLEIGSALRTKLTVAGKNG